MSGYDGLWAFDGIHISWAARKKDMNNRQATTVSSTQENITEGSENFVKEKGIYYGFASEWQDIGGSM